MTKLLPAALLGMIAFALASCGGEDCSLQIVRQKSQELQDTMTTALAKDPARAMANMRAWTGAALDLMEKARVAGSSPPADLCKAYDDQIAVVKKQAS